MQNNDKNGKLVRLMTPDDAGTFQGPDGLPRPMAEDRSIEVPVEYVSGLLARGYTFGGKPDAPQATDNPSNSRPDAIARLNAPAGVTGVGAGGRSYDVADDGTVLVQVQDVAALLEHGCTYFIPPTV